MKTYLAFQGETAMLQHGGVVPSGAIELSADQIEPVAAALAEGKRIVKKGGGFEILGITTEQQWAHVRMRRNILLAQSDWTQLADAPVASPATWAAYRQELRDLPSVNADPAAVAWPLPPA